jgi:hypothetical protein
MNALFRADPTDRADLSAFIAFYGGSLDLLTAALKSLCANGGGTWMQPDVGAHPGTHLVEIHAYGITATGLDLTQAVTSWRKLAALALGDQDE